MSVCGLAKQVQRYVKAEGVILFDRCIVPLPFHLVTSPYVANCPVGILRGTCILCSEGAARTTKRVFG